MGCSPLWSSYSRFGAQLKYLRFRIESRMETDLMTLLDKPEYIRSEESTWTIVFFYLSNSIIWRVEHEKQTNKSISGNRNWTDGARTVITANQPEQAYWWMFTVHFSRIQISSFICCDAINSRAPCEFNVSYLLCCSSIRPKITCCFFLFPFPLPFSSSSSSFAYKIYFFL